MADNYIQAGANLTIPAPANVSGGMPVFAGGLKGIAAGSVLIGESVDIVTCGVFRLPKVAVDDVALGDLIYWDATAKLATIDDNASANPLLGVAVEVAAASTGAVKVRLSAF